MNQCILVTGGAGFIGSNFILEWLQQEAPLDVINLDKLTYAGNMLNLGSIQGRAEHAFIHGDICDRGKMRAILRDRRPRAIVHFAAESHVDRSILGPEEFIRTNVQGTLCLLEEARHYYKDASSEEKSIFRFLHVSTDEVYGSLGPDDPAFTEQTRYSPSSPYSASKAASDHLVRSYYHTFGLPTLITNCSNNYGPYQFPEKLIPLMIFNAATGRRLPVYGDGLNVRDWLYVQDHCEALRVVLSRGRPGETYNIGGRNEKTNLEVISTICSLLDEMRPQSHRYQELIEFVKDRPGHDRRYAIDSRKIQSELGWTPKETFESGLRKTVLWYLANQQWVEQVTSGSYQNWISANYESREATCAE